MLDHILPYFVVNARSSGGLPQAESNRREMMERVIVEVRVIPYAYWGDIAS